MNRLPTYLALALLVSPLGLGAPPDVALDDSARVHVDATERGTPAPVDLLGTAMNPRTPDVAETMARHGVPHVRVPVYLERAALGPEDWRWSEVDRRLSLIRDAGAEPVVALGFTPSWLTSCPELEHSETRYCPPEDLTAWQELVATASARIAERYGVRAFEVWNEPDNPGFWRGTLADYLALYDASVAGLREAEAATGLDLEIGGPATVFPDPAWVGPWLAHASAHDQPVDFVSVHWYADSPFHSQAGPLPGTGVESNPLLWPPSYGLGAQMVRTLADGHGFTEAEVWITEWNLNVGQNPHENTIYGAAFLIAGVREMAQGDVDRASFFKTQDDEGGLFTADGTPQPTWHALASLLGLGETWLPVEDPAPRIAAVAGATGSQVSVVLSHLDPPMAQSGIPAPIRVELDLHGLDGAPYQVRTLDGQLVQAGTIDGPLTVRLGNPDLRVVEVRQDRSPPPS